MATPLDSSEALFMFMLYDNENNKTDTLLGHATDNVMIDYVERYLPHMKVGDRISIESVPVPKN